MAIKTLTGKIETVILSIYTHVVNYFFSDYVEMTDLVTQVFLLLLLVCLCAVVFFVTKITKSISYASRIF